MAAYYNEHDREKAAWLRELMRCGIVATGDVDERSIEDVRGGDLTGYDQCHFFAGIGVWSFALRNAGWADNSPVWTGSCPCQPFSDAGQRRGADDHRHLWPAWFRLISECRPNVVFGEQVESEDGRAWLDVVSAELEGGGFAVGAADLCAAGIGAPHKRNRLYFVADSRGERTWGNARASNGAQAEGSGSRHLDRIDASDAPEPCSATGSLEHSAGERHAQRTGEARAESGGQSPRATEQRSGEAGDVEHTDNGRCEESNLPVRPARQVEAAAIERGASFWSSADWIPCADGKLRPVEPGTFPLAHGTPARVVRLRGYGDAIVAPLAQAFVEAYLDVRGLA